MPSGAPLFDDEMVDSKANVKEKAEQLLKQGCKCFMNIQQPNYSSVELSSIIQFKLRFFLTVGLSTSTPNNLIGTSVKQEPLSDDDGQSDYGDYNYNNENFEDDDYMNSECDFGAI